MILRFIMFNMWESQLVRDKQSELKGMTGTRMSYLLIVYL